MSVAFDRAVAFYDRTRAIPTYIEREMADVIRPYPQLQQGSQVLEVGVGTGRIALPLVRQNEYRYTGVDLSRAMMNELRQKTSSAPIRLAQADVTHLPFADATFDAVIAVHVFHLISDWQSAMREVSRVLQDDGVLVHGQNHHVDADTSRVRELRNKLDEFAQADNAVREAGRLQWQDVRPALERHFGPPHEHTTSTWQIQHTPHSVIENYRQRIWSSTWAIPDATLAEAADSGERWAVERFGDLEQPLSETHNFRWEVFAKREARELPTEMRM
jgi:ubiquinone/menaquinone biosynthesis C-methylase UbiE